MSAVAGVIFNVALLCLVALQMLFHGTRPPLACSVLESRPVNDRSPGSSGRAAALGGVPSPGERIGIDPGLRLGPTLA